MTSKETTAPSERAPAPVPVESLASVTLHALATDLDNEEYPDWLRPGWLREHAADYDRMAHLARSDAGVIVGCQAEIRDLEADVAALQKALALLATVDVEGLRAELKIVFGAREHYSNPTVLARVQYRISALNAAIAAIEAARATQES